MIGTSVGGGLGISWEVIVTGRINNGFILESSGSHFITGLTERPVEELLHSSKHFGFWWTFNEFRTIVTARVTLNLTNLKTVLKLH